jgi:hypothetical protein
MDGTFTTMPMDELTKTRDVIRFMCKKHSLNNESEWGLIEQWDHPGLPGGMSERKLPNDELLLDQTTLAWEQAARKKYARTTRTTLTTRTARTTRTTPHHLHHPHHPHHPPHHRVPCMAGTVSSHPHHPHHPSPPPSPPSMYGRYGLVSMVPQSAFQLVLRKQTSLLPQARTKKEQHLEFCQALADMREGRFTTSNKEEIFELAALAVFKDLHEGMSEVETEEVT